MKIIFVFDSMKWDDTKNIDVHNHYGFIVNEIGVTKMLEGIPPIETPTSWISELIHPTIEELEGEYGTLDYWGIEDDHFNVIGYDSSEVEDENKLMKEIRKMFVRLAGKENVSKVKRIDTTEAIINMPHQTLYQLLGGS